MTCTHKNTRTPHIKHPLSQGVYSDQVRTVQNGLYYHEACLTPSTKDKESPVSARKSTPASAAKRQTASDETIEKGLETKLSARDVDEAPRSQRGVCPVCEEVMPCTHTTHTFSHTEVSVYDMHT